MHYHLKEKCPVIFLKQFSRLFEKIFIKNANVFNLMKLYLVFYQVNINNRPDVPPNMGGSRFIKVGKKKFCMVYFFR